MRIAKAYHRAGMTLALALALILVLGTFGVIVRILSHSAYREIDVISQHMKALAVGEAGFATVVTRLSATPWSQRWFKGAPDVQFDVPTAGGSYEYLLRDTKDPVPISTGQLGLNSPNQADLLVRATCEKSTVTMFWRLTVPDKSLDSVSRVIPLIYSVFSTKGPLSTSTADSLASLVDDMIRRRDANMNRYELKLKGLVLATTAPEIAEVLGLDPATPTLDSVLPLGEEPSRPNGSYLLMAAKAQAATPVVPVPAPLAGGPCAPWGGVLAAFPAVTQQTASGGHNLFSGIAQLCVVTGQVGQLLGGGVLAAQIGQFGGSIVNGVGNLLSFGGLFSRILSGLKKPTTISTGSSTTTTCPAQPQNWMVSVSYLSLALERAICAFTDAGRSAESAELQASRNSLTASFLGFPSSGAAEASSSQRTQYQQSLTALNRAMGSMPPRDGDPLNYSGAGCP